MAKHPARCAVLALILCALKLLCACSASPSEPTALPPVSVTLQLQWVAQAQFAGFYVALDKGWYAEQGIDLTIEEGGPDASPVDLVDGGVCEFGISPLADLVVAAQKGKDLLSIAQIQQSNGLLLVTKSSSNIVNANDLAGKRVGVWFGSTEAQFAALVAKVGVPMDDIHIMPQGWSMDAFLSDELDVASAMRYNEYLILQEEGLAADAITVLDYADYDLAFPGDVLFTSRETCNQQPELCAGMVRASLQGWRYAIDNPEEAVKIVLKYDSSGIQTEHHQVAMMREIASLVDVPGRSLGQNDPKAIHQVTLALERYGVIDLGVSTDQVFTDDYWAEAADEVEY